MIKRCVTCLAVLIMLLMGSVGWGSCFVKGAEEVSNDAAMQTQQYNVDVTVNEDRSYTVMEHIKVKFLEDRHGIYRYIPNKGKMLYEDENGESQWMPYYADVDMKDCNETYQEKSDDGNVLFQFGDKDISVREGDYQFTYDFVPKYQKESFDKAYYNIFPVQWQNKIPKGSRFTIHFTKDTDLKNIRLFAGEYGSEEDASNLVDLRIDQNHHMIEGTLKQDLALGNGLTFYKPMESGYFTSVHHPGGAKIIGGLTAAVLIVTAIFYFVFGRDEKIIPSIQYQPPEGLDSAAVGYVIDGTLEDKDVVSLILYWADKGYLRIEEKKKQDVLLVKIKDLEEDAPGYQKEMFRKLFQKKDSVKTSSLKYKFSDTVAVVKDQIKIVYKEQIYTAQSRVVRIIAALMTPIPFIAFIVMMAIYSYQGGLIILLSIVSCILLITGEIWAIFAVDTWYKTKAGMRKGNIAASVLLPAAAVAIYGIGYWREIRQGNAFDFLWLYVFVGVVSLLGVLFTAFMKQRTKQCIDWMGRLAGLRDFIETAELDRMKAMAEEHPEMFYHILPYASVLGVSDIFSKKLDAISLPAPEWYIPYAGHPVFHYYMIHSCMQHVASDSLMAVKAPSSMGSGGSGGFSGGGFSGGGFGGGGGGSW